ncbi:Putative periplasmic protein [hydrothermal vent metagenome]|uniref:Putative periplasmic protein n=1 Tax=hydrothermal vent metagenome TaxID=652676 RepID=A0A1W1C1M2_9ZZZZ
MNVELIAIIALCFLVFIMFILVIIRDKEVSKKLKLYGKTIEDLNRENHTITKTLKGLLSAEQVDIKAMQIQLKAEVKAEVQKSLSPLLTSINEIESVMSDFQDEQIKRIDALEDGKKVVNFAAPNMVDSNEKLIVAQYKNGKSEAMIAKDLRIGIGEVDLILKLANLK